MTSRPRWKAGTLKSCCNKKEVKPTWTAADSNNRRHRLAAWCRVLGLERLQNQIVGRVPLLAMFCLGFVIAFFHSILFIYFLFIAIFCLFFGFHDACLLLAGYVLFVCFISLLNQFCLLFLFMINLRP